MVWSFTCMKFTQKSNAEKTLCTLQDWLKLAILLDHYWEESYQFSNGVREFLPHTFCTHPMYPFILIQFL